MGRIQFDEFIDIIKCYNKIAYQIEWKSKIEKLNVDLEVLETFQKFETKLKKWMVHVHLMCPI